MNLSINKLSCCLSLSLILLAGCKEYDDTSLWKQIDEAQKQVAELSASIDALASEVEMLKELVSGGAISSISANPTGGYTVTFTTAAGEEKTIVIAASDDVVDADIIGMKEDGGVLYWTITVDGKTTFLLDADGAKIPVSGRVPSITVDNSGYWMVNGQYVLDAGGNKVKSSGKTVSLIAGLTINEDGSVTFAFGDGTSFTANSSASLYIVASIGGQVLNAEYPVEAGVNSLRVNYEVKGKLAEGAIVSLSRNDGVEVTLNKAESYVDVTISNPDNFIAGGFHITATATNGKMAVRPVYFSGSSDVEMDNNLWTVVEKKSLAPGCTYFAMEFKNVTRKMKVLEVSLTSAVEVTTSYANDCCPNPNGNGNNNNGFCIRETLSQLCARKTSEGIEVLGGVNTGFFDSNDGISRGAHIEDGQFVYMPNPKIVSNLDNHVWALTVFKDNTASCGKKKFTGKVNIGGVEKNFYSVNDTILRGGSASALKSYPINLYTYRYKQTPHASYPALVNSLDKNALYVVAKITGGGLYVNEGWLPATVTAVVNGTESQPYLTAADEIAVQINSSIADQFASVKVGDEISLNASMTIDGVSKPILTQNSTMWHFVIDGENAVGTIPVSHDFRTKQDPMTFVTINKSAQRICLIEVDGRQTGYSIGVNADECAEIALHLGAWNATRFDGGGSSAMWANLNGTGTIVTSPSDSKGERSCLNYIYVRKK